MGQGVKRLQALYDLWAGGLVLQGAHVVQHVAALAHVAGLAGLPEARMYHAPQQSLEDAALGAGDVVVGRLARSSDNAAQIQVHHGDTMLRCARRQTALN